jgi:hypothetical protein
VSRRGLESGTRRRACAVPSVYLRSSRIFWKLALNLRSMRSLKSSPDVRGVRTVHSEVSTALSSAGEMPSYRAEELESRVPTMRSIVGRFRAWGSLGCRVWRGREVGGQEQATYFVFKSLFQCDWY